MFFCDSVGVVQFAAAPTRRTAKALLPPSANSIPQPESKARHATEPSTCFRPQPYDGRLQRKTFVLK